MTDGTSDREKTLDRIVDGIRGDSLDGSTVSEMIDRTWSRIDGQVAAADSLQSCEDFQSLIPAFVTGELPDARALLVEDHTRECLACRRVMMEARGVEIAPAASTRIARLDGSRRSIVRLVAAAAVILGVLAVGVPMTGNLIADRGLEATIESVNGSILLLDHDAVTELGAGDSISSRQSLRTGKQTDAIIRLADGSLVEIDERSELSLEGSLRGTTIRLAHGNIIVRAAAQERGRLYVATKECLVAVKGTVFAVDHGLKGSRVSVIEGEVEVRRPGSRHRLSPGEQITTSDRLRSVAIREQIAWSRHADQHSALLNEITTLQRAMAKAIEPETARTSTRLLDLAPADTRIFVAAPNLAEGLAEARTIFEERLASSDALRQWWEENIVPTGVDLEIDAILDRIEPLAEAAGNEVVVAVPGRVVAGSGGPLVLFTLDDPAAFESLVTEEISDLETSGVESELVLIDDPRQVSETAAGLYVWITGDLFASSPDLTILKELAGRLDDPTAPAFPGSDLHQRLSESYARGITWLLGVDVGTFLDQAASEQSEADAELLELLGVRDVGILVAERQREGDLATITAELGFDGARKGIAAWLAEPAPMRSLEFVSPDASLAAAVVTKDPAEMFDELMTILAGAEPTALDELDRVQAETGFDLRADLAAALGGEAAFAIDGPLLPTPAWKLIVEVSDPGTLQSRRPRHDFGRRNHLPQS